MNTRIYSLDENVDMVCTDCAGMLKAGGIVAFPTETVYGLGADAFNDTAVSRIFEVKGRMRDNPLIFHVASPAMTEALALCPPKAAEIMKCFWPGPLSLVLRSRIDRRYSFGLDTVAIRMPDNLIALTLIEKLAGPVVAPSANVSGRPSGTDVEHVVADFDGAIDAIIDGGRTVFGIESTVIDATAYPFVLLRPGALSVSRIREAGFDIIEIAGKELLGRSPGTRYRHYAPAARIVLVEEAQAAVKQSSACGFMGLAAAAGTFDRTIIFDSVDDYARKLFATLRYMDACGIDTIVAALPPADGVGAAVRDRLFRAAAGGKRQ